MPPETATSPAPRQHGAMEYSTPPVDLDAVRLERLGRIRAELKRQGLPAALFFNQINTRYATDATNMQVWCSHYETRSVFIAAEGPCVLFDFANHSYLAEDLPGIDEYRVMPTHNYFSAGVRGEEKAARFAGQIAELMARHCGRERRLAVDRLGILTAEALAAQGIQVVEGECVSERARALKSPGEIELMRASIQVAEEACWEMWRALRPGMTENALWAKMHETNIRLGGEWIETRLLSAGPRTNPWYRECSMREIEQGEMVSFDTDLIGPYGYCADFSRAWARLRTGGDVSDGVAARFPRGQARFGQRIHRQRHDVHLDEVELHVLARRDVAVATRVIARDTGQ